MTPSIECPCCGTLVEARAHRGIVINARASLGSDIVTYEKQLAALDPVKEAKAHAAMLARLGAAREKLTALDRLYETLRGPS